MGDFNLDPLRYNHHMPNSRRLTSYSAILIDNIFTYQLPNDVYNDIILNDLSDRFPVFTYFHDEQLSPTGGKNFFKRSFNERNLNKFNGLLSRTN